MTLVNPPPHLKIPQAFLKDNEVLTYFQNKDLIIYQLWLRSGGADDLSDDTDLNVLNQIGLEQIEGVENNILPFPIDVSERLEQLENSVSSNNTLETLEAVQELLAIPGNSRVADPVELIFTPVTANYTLDADDDVIYCDSASPFTITLLAEAAAHKLVIIKNFGAGTVTLTPDGSETTEVTSLTTTQSSTLGPRAGVGWVSL